MFLVKNNTLQVQHHLYSPDLTHCFQKWKVISDLIIVEVSHTSSHWLCNAIQLWGHYSSNMSWRGITGQNQFPQQFKNKFWIQNLFSTWLVAILRFKSPIILLIARGRIVGFMPFPRVLALCETKTALSKIWTLVAESTSYDNNHYTIWECWGQ